MAVTMKNAIFWDVAPCRSCVNRRFRGTYHLHLQGRKIRVQGTSMSRWLNVIQFYLQTFLCHTSMNICLFLCFFVIYMFCHDYMYFDQILHDGRGSPLRKFETLEISQRILETP
jgi:hypothetical protein